MTDDRLPFAELMQKAGGDDFLRSVAEAWSAPQVVDSLGDLN
jgi:hypothetical protein